jgi:hypothetical protein
MVLATQVHENHMFAAVPLLALAAGGRRRFFPVFVAVSGIHALNLNLLYGLGEDTLRYGLSRMMAGVDLTLVPRAANCTTLVCHAVVLRRQCEASGSADSPNPEALQGLATGSESRMRAIGSATALATTSWPFAAK